MTHCYILQMAYPLKPKCQTYAWGKDAQHSLVAQYMKTCDSTFSIDPAANYAEVCVCAEQKLIVDHLSVQLWMGTHAKGPSSIEVNGSNVSLATWIQENQASLGERVLGRWGVQLPFLFKVLSIRTALSIQVRLGI
jgi:mannose-6-phosphate isomerase